ncbi:DUF4097 family beta strand repeat-containing protein [Humibacter ginsenosidimutans]|uniref:DUF4097 domain-containing protein n=1 Tax=Humibacter ginsenosidimutans TaxID=2599293 RepID=A0A5B8M5U1_9MICO|nr:hypothetical protein [Humibacter ginsenosidimutans]QDZ15743.1 hypothetical protein FPZ11_14115 [Humibacter ginsenosidimutans]
METEYETPQPIRVVLDLLVVVALRVTATDTTTTTVSVKAADPTKKDDVRALGEVSVDFIDGVLGLRIARTLRYYTWFSGSPRLIVDITVPTGSSLEGKLGAGNATTEGVLGECSLRTGAGELRVEHAGATTLHSGAGAIQAGRVGGPLRVTNGAGSIRVGTLEGEGYVKNTTGSTVFGEVEGPLTMRSVTGDVLIEQLNGSAEIKCAHGEVRIDRVGTGEVRIDGGYGSIEVGVPEGTAAWLDIASKHGAVHNGLETTSAPVETDRTVAVTAHADYASITIRRPLT